MLSRGPLCEPDELRLELLKIAVSILLPGLSSCGVLRALGQIVGDMTDLLSSCLDLDITAILVPNSSFAAAPNPEISLCLSPGETRVWKLFVSKSVSWHPEIVHDRGLATFDLFSRS